ncbi:DUF979 domain-containing protein [Clostridium sp. P21]|uniref:DUF979 domain-containing protein n=1 Tax=Clostridium muellerianum TaxID=2716538 RepID=A0A7Y0EF93_9CLOT|nr:DUF979 domain-containing protein [Clostridium muellerianum]NMM62303.1 DUF979 domain-containing protein [Clostridium muellerianum]
MSIKIISKILLEIFCILSGVMMIVTAYYVSIDKKHPTRIGTTAFWALLGIVFMGGTYMPNELTGGLILIMGILTALKQVNIGKLLEPTEEFKENQSKKIGSKIFVPSVILAVAAFVVAQYTKLGGEVAIGISALVAIIFTIIITKSPLKNVIVDGDRMMQQVGPSNILPQLLAALGTVFTTAGVGQVISQGISTVMPKGNILLGVIVYCISMAIFTIIMGNAFAAFAVITAGVGIPFVFSQGANPAIASALALTAGYCGTLMTPMAANFNVVPAALLETKSKNRIIITQLPVAILLLIIHIILMYKLAF